jgi:DNA-binding Lrp family transcriptional regulator
VLASGQASGGERRDPRLSGSGDRKVVGLGVLAFVRVQIDSHSDEEARRFEAEVAKLPEVVACYSIAGEADSGCRWLRMTSTPTLSSR